MHQHPNDKTPNDAECEAALDALGNDRGQGLDPFWKWAFREGWQAARRTTRDAQAECAHKFVPYYEGVQLCEKCKTTQAECGKSSGEAVAHIQYSDELTPRTPGEKAAYLEGIEEGKMRAKRDAKETQR